MTVMEDVLALLVHLGINRAPNDLDTVPFVSLRLIAHTDVLLMARLH